MNVTVVWATPRVQDLISFDVEPGTTAADAIARSGFALRYGVDPARMTVAIFGRRVSLHVRLADGDRVEITRPLVVDPKEGRVRRVRAESPAASSPTSKRRQSR
jgi:putative ubiquitin-RnfH superfamily antitoxin RatB of RatAB toxin-antitoxin module